MRCAHGKTLLVRTAHPTNSRRPGRVRRGHRRYLLHRAAAPLKAKLGAKAYERLLKALSLVYGIEPYVILKDIWGVSDREVERIALWMADALVDAALREAATGATVLHLAKAPTRKRKV